MRILLLLLALLIGSVLFGRWLLADPGYVLLIRDGLRVETSLGLILIGLIVVALLWSVITLLLVSLWDLAGLGRAGRWRTLIARRRLRAGFFALTEGDWPRAARLLRSASHEPWSVPAGLGEALAEWEQGNHEQVREALQRVTDSARGAPVAELAMARILLADGSVRQARTRLEQLGGRKFQNNPYRLRLLAEALERDRDWSALVEMLPALKTVSRDPKAFSVREQRVWLGLLEAVSSAPGEPGKRLEELRRTWRGMPDTLQKQATVRAAYAGYLITHGDGAAALALIKKDIERHWDDRLIAVLEGVNDVPPEKLLQQLEHWLEPRPGNVALLMCAGRMAMKARLWGKARSYFEAAARAGNVVALAELARLHSALGDTSRALAALERRLSLLGDTLPTLPLPHPTRDPDDHL